MVVQASQVRGSPTNNQHKKRTTHVAEPLCSVTESVRRIYQILDYSGTNYQAFGSKPRQLRYEQPLSGVESADQYLPSFYCPGVDRSRIGHLPASLDPLHRLPHNGGDHRSSPDVRIQDAATGVSAGSDHHRPHHYHDDTRAGTSPDDSPSSDTGPPFDAAHPSPSGARRGRRAGRIRLRTGYRLPAGTRGTWIHFRVSRFSRRTSGHDLRQRGRCVSRCEGDRHLDPMPSCLHERGQQLLGCHRREQRRPRPLWLLPLSLSVTATEPRAVFAYGIREAH